MGFSGSRVAIALGIACLGVSGCSPSLGEVLKAEGCQLYYTPEVSLETANTVLEFLVSEGFCAGEGRRVQLATNDEVLELRVATQAEVRSDPAYLDLAKTFAAQLSGKVLEGRPVDVAICDESLDVVTRSPGHRWGRYVSDEACGIYVGPTLTPQDGTRFLTLVKEDLGCATERSFRLAREAGDLNLYFVLDDSALEASESFHQARLTAGRASTVLFEGSPITVHVADVYYVSKRSAPGVSLGPSVTRGACQVFRGEGVDAETMARFVAFIDAAGFCRSDPKVYRLSHVPGDGWHLAVVIRQDVPPAFERAFKIAFGLVGALLRGVVFDLAPTYIDLCNPVFQACESIVGPDLGKAFLLGRCSVFHDPGIDEGTLDRFRGWLSKERFCEEADQVLRLRRGGEGWEFHLAVRAALHGSDELATLGGKLQTQLSREVFEGAAVRFVGTNEGLVHLR